MNYRYGIAALLDYAMDYFEGTPISGSYFFQFEATFWNIEYMQ